MGYLLADIPIQRDKLGVDGNGGLDLRGLNTVFQVGNQVPVFVRFENVLAHSESVVGDFRNFHNGGLVAYESEYLHPRVHSLSVALLGPKLIARTLKRHHSNVIYTSK